MNDPESIKICKTDVGYCPTKQSDDILIAEGVISEVQKKAVEVSAENSYTNNMISGNTELEVVRKDLIQEVIYGDITPEEAAKELIEAAQAVEKAGAFMLVLEGIPEKLAAIITKKVHIPTIGIGASAECDGQVLVYQDMLAMYGNFVPKFVKQFAQVGEVMQGAVKDYINAVKEGTFPGPENTYAISDDVIEKLY